MYLISKIFLLDIGGRQYDFSTMHEYNLRQYIQSENSEFECAAAICFSCHTTKKCYKCFHNRGVQFYMNMKGHNLKLGLRGDPVSRIHEQLAALNYKIPAVEFKKSNFGKSTQEAVKKFQFEHHLEVTGIVDAATKAALETAIAGQKIKNYEITGHIFSENGLIYLLLHSFLSS